MMAEALEEAEKQTPVATPSLRGIGRIILTPAEPRFGRFLKKG